jgi:nitrate reductase gamma subunit
MSDLLDFARGTGLQISVAIFIGGVIWRLVSLLMVPKVWIASPPKPSDKSPIGAAFGEIFGRMIPHKNYMDREMFPFVNGWVFHIGLFLSVFTLAPHIMFIKKTIGISWPNIPSNLVFLIAVITLGSLIAALIHRLTNPILKKLSNSDDYFAWFVTFLPVLTGIAATLHLGLRYETLLALHILSICLFLVWFPFGKLMHAILVFYTRGKTGMELARRGVKL